MLRGILAAVVAGLLVAGASVSAHAEWGVDVDSTDNTADLTVFVTQGGGSGSGGLGGPGVPCPTGHLSKTAQCSDVNGGSWNYAGCYIRVLGGGSTTGQGGLSDLAHDFLDDSPSFEQARTTLEEHNGEGSIIECGRPYDCPVGDARHDLCLTFDYYWVPFAAGDANVLASVAAAIAQMHLQAPQVGMTGGSPPDGMQIVGIPAWMWAADPGESTTGPITRYGSSGAVTVSATGRLDRTVWSMGDGVTITCSGENAAGTPYEARYDKLPSPTCGYTYTRTSAGQPNEAFTVTVTAYWVVDWSGGGQSGTVDLQMSRSIPKQVGELQALIISQNGKH